MLRTGIALAALLAVLPLPSAAAQEQSPQASDSGPAQGPPAATPRPTADQLLEAESQSLKPPGTVQRCRSPKGNEIVVCAGDPDEQRVPSDTDQGLDTRDGLPRAPDVFGIPDRGIVVAKGCFFPPCPRKMPPIIDLKAIPEAPPGSDAARFKEDADARKAAAARSVTD